MAMRTVTTAAGLSLACLLALTGSAQGQGEGGFVRISPGEIHWVDMPNGHGAQFASLLGDPSKPGIYVVRARFPPWVMDAPHTHSQDRYVTVLQGTWYTGTGPVFDPARAVPLKPGSLMLHPARGVHWDGSRSAETVIVQIIGMGPVDTVQVDPKAQQWRVVKP
jgi:hypothetical protein